MTTPHETPPEPGASPSPEEIKADIERTREQLGQTVEALTERLDVKARAKKQVATVRRELAQRSRQVKADSPAVLVPLVTAAAVVAVALVMWRRRR